eukprot:NODE_749_length_4226_cov_0.916404.p1 type:complete len:213 gc:universal NODE_749_length_4226_cov_0.916404:722-84(-)
MKQFLKPVQFPSVHFITYLKQRIFHKALEYTLLNATLGNYYPNEFLNGCIKYIPSILSNDPPSMFTNSIKSYTPFNITIQHLQDVYIHNVRFKLGHPIGFTKNQNIVIDPVHFTMLSYNSKQSMNAAFNLHKNGQYMNLADGFQLIIDVGIKAFTKMDSTTIKNHEMILSFNSPYYASFEEGLDSIPEWQIFDFQYLMLQSDLNQIYTGQNK